MAHKLSSFEKKIEWFKDHPKWSLVIFAGAVVIALGAVSGSIKSIVDLGLTIWPKSNPSANQNTTQASQRPQTEILITHYPSGELFAVDPISGQLSLVSARLGEPSAVAVRPSGEIIVLDASHGDLTGVDRHTGVHRDIAIVGGIEAFQGRIRPIAFALISGDAAVVAAGDALIRVNLDTGEQSLVTKGGHLSRISGVTVDASGSFLVTDLDGGVIEIAKDSLVQRVVAHGTPVHFPRAPLVDRSGNLMIGTAGDSAAVLRIDRDTGKVTTVASGPFVTIAGLAFEPGGALIVADNGRGAPGDGFIARVDPSSGIVTKVVTAQSSGWRFLNGRGVAVYVPSN